MKIGIIGSGIVGQVLAKAFKSEGYEVKLGTRNVLKEQLNAFKNTHPDIEVATFSEVARFGEILVLATNGAVTVEVIQLVGYNHFKNKVVIDTTNPIAASPPVHGVLSFFTDPNSSLMETIQELIPEAKLVKAFNSVGNAFMYKPSFKDGPPTMFICGNHDDARKQVAEILEKFGWDVADMGKAAAARAIEPLCILWCIPGFINNQWSHAFKLIKSTV